jgi:hypothetical protein
MSAQTPGVVTGPASVPSPALPDDDPPSTPDEIDDPAASESEEIPPEDPELADPEELPLVGEPESCAAPSEPTDPTGPQATPLRTTEVRKTQRMQARQLLATVDGRGIEAIRLMNRPEASAGRDRVPGDCDPRLDRTPPRRSM